MVIKGLFNKLFSGDDSSSAAKPSEGGINDLENFVDYIVRALVDYPTDVKVTADADENGDSIIKIECKKEDIGKVVGKRGKTIMAIRSLVSGAAGRMRRKVAVEVMD